jgi:hypothetical protein
MRLDTELDYINVLQEINISDEKIAEVRRDSQ